MLQHNNRRDPIRLLRNNRRSVMLKHNLRTENVRPAIAVSMLACTLPRYHAARNRAAAFCQGELNDKMLRRRAGEKVLFAAILVPRL